MPNSLGKIAVHETVKKKNKETLKRVGARTYSYLSNLSSTVRLFKLLIKFESIWDGYLERINISKHGTVLINEEVRPVHSAPSPAGPIARQFAAAERNRMLAGKGRRAGVYQIGSLYYISS